MINDKLIDHLVETEALKTPRIERAFRAVDRADFVLPDQKGLAYHDQALPIGYEATISQPSTVAFMLELLQPQPGDRILDVGSGSGWTTALLGQIVGSEGWVFGIELVPQLVEFGSANLTKYGLKGSSIRLAGQTVGLAAEAPFDKILVSAAAIDLPVELTQQLKPTGIMVMPVGHSVCKVTKTDSGGITQDCHPGFAFVPLR